MSSYNCNLCPHCKKCNCLELYDLMENIRSMVECPTCGNQFCSAPSGLNSVELRIAGALHRIYYARMYCVECDKNWTARPQLITQCRSCKKVYRANIMRYPKKVQECRLLP